MAQAKEDFWSRYSKMCLQDKIYPSKSIIKNFKSTDLSCIVEAVRSEHWKYLLLALCRDNSLTKVHFASAVSPHEDEDEIAPENIGLKLVSVPAGQVDCQAELCIGCCSSGVYKSFIPVVDIQARMKKQAQYFPTPYGRTPKNINNITIALNNLLQKSQTLNVLKLENLSLTLDDAEQLAHGLSKSSSLKYFSLSGCHFDEGAIPIICKSLNVSSVSWIDFSFCALSPQDIEAVANVIKCHCVRRRNEMFQKTLRNQVPYLQDMPGLTRVSLNYNSMEDKSLKVLIDSLADDLWVKALDLQNCDIDNSGALALLHLASTNTSLVIIDLRMNQIDESVLNKITKQLEQNKTGKDVKCSELPLWKPSELVRKYNNIGKVKTIKKPTAHKFKISKKVTKSYLNVKKKQRIEELVESFRNEPAEERYSYLISQVEKTFPFKDQFKDASSQTPTDPRDVNELLVMVKNLRHRLQNEMKIRKFLLAKYRQINIENAQLRQMLKSQNDDIYIDQETFFDVKHTFEKLKVFFDVMKKYGLWEYISMLGFDESTDVVLEESNSQKCMKVTRDINYTGVESSVEFDREVCCNCRKLDYKHRKVEPPEDGHHCMTGTSSKPKQTKLVKDDRINDKIAYKVSQEAFHHVLNSKSVSNRIPDNLSQEGIKASSSKHPGSASPNTAAGAQMLIKKFSYSNMPKQLKELVSPTDFYNIVKKELERCETEAKKPYNPIPTAENYESSNSTQVGSIQSKKVSYKTYKPRNEANAISTAERRGSLTMQDIKLIDEDFENLTITELLNREKAGKLFPKTDAKPSASTVSSSKVCKNTNHAKIKETKSLSKSEEVLPQSKPKLSNSHANCKGPQSKYNASSDEINSSDSVVTASDNVSSRSSVSSSSSNKSHGKLSDVTDASTFGEIESIADAEVVSEAFLPVGSIIESVKSSVDTVTSGPTSSHSSTLKDASESKSNKSNKSAISGSSAKDLSKKDDSSSKTNAPPQGKGKNANKHKNRPKSNSSKSSSIPSLSDITTVSSKSLKTYSVMKQIPGSDDDKSKGKK